MKIKFKDISIIKRLTAVYIIFILVPFLALSIFIYRQTRFNIQSEIIRNGQVALEQIKQNIQSKTELIESIGSNISYNYRLQSFLSSDFDVTASSFEDYRDYILPIIQYSSVFQRVNIQGISVYMVNHSIPEGYGIFFHDSNINKKDWFKKFIESDKRMTWLVSSRNDLASTTIFESTPSYICIQKIISPNGKYLGLTVVSISLNDLFASLGKVPEEDETVFILDRDDKPIFSNKASINLGELLKTKDHDKSKGYLVSGNNLYLYENIPSLDATIGMEVSISKKARSMRTIPAAILSFIVILIASITFFYMVLRLIFWKINKNIRIMNNAIKEDLSIRIPVDSKDEIGQVAEKFNILLDKINALIKDIVKKETAHKDAQLKALQFQINPHFIYNTIDIFAGKLEIAGNYEIADAIADFGKMLRYNINSQALHTTILSEVNYVKSYINLQKLRYDQRLSLTVNLPDKLYNYNIIKFILQPIVENSIIHGMNDNDSHLNISIDFSEQSNKQIEIIVTDNGVGIDAKRLISMNHQFKTSEYIEYNMIKDGHIGLQNINERLKLFYGREYYIRLESVKGMYTKTIINIPILES